MQTKPASKHRLERPVRNGMTLIELIGVLAIIAIVAAALVPVLIRQLDKAAADQESAALKSFSTALQRSAQRNRYIPGATDWASVVAAELGANPSDVSTNARSQPRFFLVDPGLRIGPGAGSGLPYRQGTRGSTNPASPRLMILSSLGQPLTNLVSGAPNSTNFNAIWDWTDNSSTPPAPLSYLKRADDLKIQRLNLSPLFVHLVLTTNASDVANYSISTNAVNSQTDFVPVSPWLDQYFIMSSVLGLYTNNGSGLDSQQILTRDSSFIYEGGAWRNTLLGPASGGGGGTGIFPSAYSIVTNFLASPRNTAAGASSQADVVQVLIDYMKAYDAWAGSNFTNANFRSSVGDTQALMITIMDKLCCNPVPPQGP
jgi:prepilin-type N-terminal cleavage/methylation domain-containing protein